jgi:putative ABC transport system substrate-binding protein
MMAFTKRLAELGWLEGKNIEYLLRYAQGNPNQYSTLIGETLAQKPDVIYAPFGPFALAAKKHTSDVPIVFSIVDDPVRLGLVGSLARPGGNATGVTTRSRELTGKQLQILKELVPTLRRIGVTGVVTTPEHVATIEELKRTATQLGFELIEARQELDQKDLAAAFAALKRERVEALVGLTYLWSEFKEFVDHANRAGLPAMYDAEEFVQAGGLISYSVSFAERYREAANYVDRILRGARPADLPVEEPTRFTLALNLRTARSLGLEIPQSVLLRADRVIE